MSWPCTPIRLGRLCMALLGVTVASAVLLGNAQAQTTPAEQARIEQLLTRLAQDQHHQFERSGKRYTGSEAARFLRAKWQAKGGTIRTAEEFVEQIASRSTTTGKPYQVCTAPAACVPAAEHLKALLKGG